MPPPRDQPVKNWPKGAKGLLATSASPTVLVAVITLGPVIPYGTATQPDGRFDVLWRDGFWQ